MSRAFVKEDAAQPDEDPPERPLSPHPNYITRRGLELLHTEQERLIKELGPLAGTQLDSARKKKRTLERDLRYVRARLDSAIPVDPALQPKGEIRFGARVELTSRVVRIVGEDEAAEGGEFLPWPAPLAQSLLGLKPGDTLGDETIVSVSY